jgi:hypothetical protein
VVSHQPKTYETQEVEGVTSFLSYDQRLVNVCEADDVNNTCHDISVGTYFNDLWRYQLGAWPAACPRVAATGLRRVACARVRVACCGCGVVSRLPVVAVCVCRSVGCAACAMKRASPGMLGLRT